MTKPSIQFDMESEQSPISLDDLCYLTLNEARELGGQLLRAVAAVDVYRGLRRASDIAQQGTGLIREKRD